MEHRIQIESPVGLKLAGILLRPERVTRPPVVVFAHGWGSSKASQRNRAIAEALVQADIAALLFDFSGHGDSEGSFDQVTLEDQVGDLQAVLDLAAADDGLGEVGVAGSSSGAAVAIAAAADDPRVGALVLRAPSAAARRSLAVDVEAPTLLIQGERDPLCDRNRKLALAFRCEHRLCLVPGAGHLFEEPGSFDPVVRETVRWFRRWLLGETENAGGQAHGAGEMLAADPPTHFANREQAGAELAKRLQTWAGADTIVIGLPRGGVVVAARIAEALGAELNVFVSRKVRAPSQPELAIGALAEGDVVLWNESIVEAMGLGEAERERQLGQARSELEERLASYRAVAPRGELRGRTVIVVDDGVATGATLRAAIEAIRREGPARLVVALPGGPEDTLEEIACLDGVDELVVLATPEHFWAVGQLYDSFGQVSTDEVCDALRVARRRRRPPPPPPRASGAR